MRVRASYELGAADDAEVRDGGIGAAGERCAAALAKLGQRHDWVGEDDLVFVGIAGGYLDGSTLRRRYKEALGTAGLRPLRFHDSATRLGPA